jgi:formylglycine-generating enzyme required for sulfatase activity
MYRYHRLFLVGIAACAAVVVVGCHGAARERAAVGAVVGASVGVSQAGLRGDLNGNGNPDVSDAIGILRIVVGLDGPNALADCDGDGNTGVADAILLLRCVVGLDDWPIGGVTETVGPEGGTITFADGRVVLEVPAGALLTATDIAVSPQATCPAGDGLVPGTCYEFAPEGTEFARPAQLTIAYDESALAPGTEETDLAIHRVVGGVWGPAVGAAVDADANTVSAWIGGFSGYGILARRRQAGQEMIGPDGQTLVWVPGGSFMMGSADWYEQEQPVHQVTLDGFWVGQCEVTNDQYAAFLNRVAPASVSSWVDMADEDCGIEKDGSIYFAKQHLGPHPMVEVSWHGTAAYCEHYGYALPTEAQWEYAAAGPDSHIYPWGDVWDAAKCCNSTTIGPYGRTFPVGSFPTGASWCGALDMAGNVFEWCADWYSDTYYQVSPVLNPPGPVYSTTKVLRGGSWSSNEYGSGGEFDPDYCRAAFRYINYPASTDSHRGFRCAASP